jgi:hypothetical protein
MKFFQSSLAVFDEIFSVLDTNGRFFWRVKVGAAKKELSNLATHVGGREIHIIPFHELGPISFNPSCRPDPIQRRINPRKMLTETDLDKIRAHFPTSSGIQILLSGYAVLLYEDAAEMKESWNSGIVDSIGGLPLQHAIDSRQPSVTYLHPGQTITDRTTSPPSMCAMGLKIKLPNGMEGITTVTHGFVRGNQSAVNLKLGIFEWYTRLKKALSSFHYYCPKLPYVITTTRSFLTAWSMYISPMVRPDRSELGTIKGLNQELIYISLQC